MPVKNVHNLVQRWRACDLARRPYLFPDDTLDSLRGLARTHASFEEYISSPDFGPGTEHALHTGLIPMPYAGNLATASIFILLLNPGLSYGDYYAEDQPEFRDVQIRSLRQENAGERYPFHYLDPRFAWHPGFVYWHNKFQALIAALSDQRRLAYQEAMSVFARAVACLELLPYHSKSFGAGALLGRLPSVQAMRAFVQEVLLPKAQARDALVIITRGIRTWGLAPSTHIVAYGRGEARAAYLTPSSSGGAAIMRHLGLRVPPRGG